MQACERLCEALWLCLTASVQRHGIVKFQLQEHQLNCLLLAALALSDCGAVDILSSWTPGRSACLGRLEEGHLPPQLGHLIALKDLALSCYDVEAGRVAADKAGKLVDMLIPLNT